MVKNTIVIFSRLPKVGLNISSRLWHRKKSSANKEANKEGLWDKDKTHYCTHDVYK